MNKLTCEDIRKELIRKYKAEEFVLDRTGVKTVEILAANFKADRDWLIRKPNLEYVEAEIQWYRSLSTNIKDIYGEKKDAPKAWKASADSHGNINSNYGHLIWSEKYYNQYAKCLLELEENPDSRRALMIYTRPSIWVEYNEGGKNDMICTLANQFFIRDGKLHSFYQMRSNDSVFGFCNDVHWARHVHRLMAFDLEIELGDLYWSSGSLHVYERDFKYLENPIEE